MRYLIAFIILLIGCIVVSANPPQRVRVVPAQQFLATQFGTITIPTYGAGYNGQISPEDFKALIDEIRLMRQAFEKLAAVPNDNPKGPPPKQDGSISKAANIFAAKCASCHDKSVAELKGGKFAFMDKGVIMPLSTDAAMSILLQIEDNSMPKAGPKLTDQEFADVMQLFRTLKANTAKQKK